MISRRNWMQLAALGAPALLAADEIPSHPRDLKFSALRYAPPDPKEHRHELPGGAVAYLVEDHELPLVSIRLSFRAAGWMVPEDLTGLAGMTGSQMRAGGTTSLSAREFDEETAFLATGIGSSLGATSGSASVGCLKQNLDRSLELLWDMLKNPGFDEQRFQLSVARTLQGMPRRNDDSSRIATREYRRLMRGEHFTTRTSTEVSIKALTVEAMRETHQRWFHPSRFVFSVSGDFETQEMLDRLSEAIAAEGWPDKQPDAPPVPEPSHQPKPGVYMIDMPELNQAQVRMGHLGIERSNPDHIAVGIMNDILGGGGFTSRIMSRVRSDEGLAYSAGSSFPPGTYYPGTFTAAFGSDNSKSAQATTIVMEELEKMRSEKVTDAELSTSKNYAVEIFPRFFASAGQVAGTFASDELTDREEGYWDKYRERVSSVTADDVLRVAQKYLHPENLVILGVGNKIQMTAGNPDLKQFSFETLAGDGGIQELRLPDPMTMEYPEG